MLQEMTEEWEQCDRKLGETRDWLLKSRASLESMQNKRRPIRDQLALREKIAGEISIQRTKAVMAVEKLQVDFDKLPSLKSMFTHTGFVG